MALPNVFLRFSHRHTFPHQSRIEGFLKSANKRLSLSSIFALSVVRLTDLHFFAYQIAFLNLPMTKNI